MQSPRRFIILSTVAGAIAFAGVAGVAGVGGCRQKAQTDDPDQQVIDLRKEAKWEEQPTGIRQEPVVVAQGPTPLVHLFDIGGPIRVVDLTSKARLVAMTVPNRTLVRIDDRNGVTVGKDNLVPGPLPPGHEYGIYLDPTTPNVYRQGIGPPGDVPASAAP